MAVNVVVYNLDQYPGNPKTVVVDLESVVPLGNGGEDVWVVSSRTTATSSGTAGVASIQKLYIRDTKFGWIKSSGLKAGPYAVTGSRRHLRVAIDEDIGSAVEVALTSSSSLVGGEAVATDLQTAVNNLAKIGGSKEGNVSYLNAVVRFIDGRFEIVSGTAASSYVGVDRSSVVLADGTTTTGLLAELGFDISFTSQSMAANNIKQTSLASGYTSGTSLTVVNTGIVSTGDCIAITDGANVEYRGVTTANGVNITLASGMANDYAAGSLVQVLSLKEPSGELPSTYSKIDDYLKYAVSYIANQIDFSR